jgi:WhiB family redox-sensing transcriptional regulator
MSATQDEIIYETKVVLAADVAWRADARCNDSSGSMVGLFFSDELQDIAAAKAICAKCPVIADCLEGAINGRVLASKRRRGRPPKVARPEDELPDVPVPVHLRDRLRTA